MSWASADYDSEADGETILYPYFDALPQPSPQPYPYLQCSRRLCCHPPGRSSSNDAEMVPADSSWMLVARWRPPASSGGGTAMNVTSAPSTMDALGKRASLKWKKSRASRLAHLRARYASVGSGAACFDAS